jgi:hypothetical protein
MFYKNSKGLAMSKRFVGLVIVTFFLLFIHGLASVPSDAQTIGLGQMVEGWAPGAYYKVLVPSPGSLSVILDQVPAEMLTRIAIINETDAWLAEQDASAPGQLITAKARADTSGWYYIGILDLEGKSHETSYIFHVTWGQ